LGVRGFKKLRFLLQKARPCVNPRRLSHFASKSVEGCDLQVGLRKKNRESHRASHRKDMSPLTQGLNYRSACDLWLCEGLRAGAGSLSYIVHVDCCGLSMIVIKTIIIIFIIIILLDLPFYFCRFL